MSLTGNCTRKEKKEKEKYVKRFQNLRIFK